MLADLAANIELTQSWRRPAKEKPQPSAKTGQGGQGVASADATGATAGAPDATGGDNELVLVDGVMVTFVQAQRIKENYLARQRMLQFEKETGRLVDREAAEKAFFEQGR